MIISRKILSCMLVLLMLLSLVPAQVFAEELEAEGYIPPEKYTHELARVTALGVYSFGKNAAEDNVSRAQFAQMAMDLIAMGDTASSGNVSFTDVTAETEYADAIFNAAALGIMNGMGNSQFHPTDNITYVQAVKTLVCTLGYEPYADGTGGYAAGYMGTAKRIGLLKDAPDDYNEVLTFERAVYLIALAAEAPVFEIMSIGENNIEFVSDDNRYPLSVYHEINVDDGIMTDNGVTSLNGSSAVGKNGAVIGSRSFSSSPASAKALLGYDVKYYYRTGGSVDELVYAEAMEKSNDVVVINAKDLLTDSPEFSKTKVVAQVGSKQKKYTLHQYAALIYNGEYDATFTGKTLKLKAGDLKLLDADGDGTYETVFAEEYVDIIARSASPADEKLLAKYAPDKAYNVINYGDYSYVVFENEYGEEIEPSVIKEDTVVSVFRSKNKGKIRFVAVNTPVEITVDAVSKDGGHTRIDTGDNSYYLSVGYEAMMKDGKTAFAQPVAGSMYRILLNFEGEIAAAEELEGRSQYAYFMGIKSGSGLTADEVYLKLVLETGDCAAVTVAKKVAVNLEENKTPADVKALPSLYNEGEIKPQLVKIVLNGKGELTDIETATDTTATTFRFDLNRFSLDYKHTTHSAAYTGGGAKAIGGAHCVDKNTVFFVVTVPDIKLSTAEEQEVKVIDYATYNTRYGSSYHYAQLYDANEAWLCKAALISARTGEEGRPFIVDSSTTIMDEYGETKQKVSGWWKGGYWSFREAKEGIFANAVKARGAGFENGKIMPGDVLLVSFDLNQDIDKLELAYSPMRETKGKVDYIDGTLIGTGTTVGVLGAPYAVEDTRIGLYTNNGDTPMYWVNLLASNCSVMQYDCRTKQLTQISKEEIPISACVNSTGTGMDIIDTDTMVYLTRSRSVVYDVLVVTNVSAIK